jgi:hypothetical protein
MSDLKFKNLLRKGYKVKLLEEKAAGPTLVIREFEVSSDLDGGKPQKCTQLHYVGWPDHGVPTGSSMNDFSTLLNHLIHMLLNSSPE